MNVFWILSNSKLHIIFLESLKSLWLYFYTLLMPVFLLPNHTQWNLKFYPQLLKNLLCEIIFFFHFSMFPQNVLIICLVYTTIHIVVACMCMSAWIDCEPLEDELVYLMCLLILISSWQIASNVLNGVITLWFIYWNIYSSTVCVHEN